MTTRLLASYGRKRGKPLKSTKRGLMETLLPQLLWDRSGLLAATDHSPLATNHYLEIGYGYGEYLAQKAKLYPERRYIGCEVYEQGIATLLSEIAAHKLENIRLYADDARKLLADLPDGALAGVDILFPDPWPKKRHHKRRLINPEMLDLLHAKMQPGARLFLATDHADYLQWMLAQMMARTDFVWDGNWREPPADYVMTRYEQKARESGNHAMAYLHFMRK